MLLSDEQILSDLDRQLVDWGVTITHQLVTSTFDPDTLVNDETVTQADFTALVTTNRAATAAGTGGQYQDPQLSITLRTADLPEAVNGQLRRFVVQDQVFDVLGVDVLAAGRVTILHCRKRVNA